LYSAGYLARKVWIDYVIVWVRWGASVKIPLDYICVKSGILCPRCQALVDSGEVDSREVDIMRALIELEESGNQLLKKAVYHKAYFIDSQMIVIVMDLGVGSSVPVYTKYARNIEKGLANKLGVKVKLIPHTSDLRSLALHLLYPARVLGVNTLWLPNGSVEYVVRVSRRDRRFLEKNREFFEKILTELSGKKVQIRYE